MSPQPSTSVPENPSQSVVFELLSDSRRRRVLDAVAERDEPATVRGLALRVALAESDAETVGADHYRRVYTSLYHCHLPKLADAGVVDYDAVEERVRPGPHATAVSGYLAVA